MACPMFNLLCKLQSQTNILSWFKRVVAVSREREIRASHFPVLCHLSNMLGITPYTHVKVRSILYVSRISRPELSSTILKSQ